MRLCGVLLVDKPTDITSHDVVSALRRFLHQQTKQPVKIGHLGTLDPFATGLLPILVGGATRLADMLMEGEKQYAFQIQFGAETDTLDHTGQVQQEKPVPPNFAELVQGALSSFTGSIEQTPPAYSALKMNGRPLYEYMRAQGKLPCAIETKRRPIVVSMLECVSWDQAAQRVTLRVRCGKGTYVRSLARDIAYHIGTVGHCCWLRREGVGNWSVDKAWVFSRQDLSTLDTLLPYLIAPEQLLPHIPTYALPAPHENLFRAGNQILLTPQEAALYAQVADANPLCFVKTQDDSVMALCALEHTPKGLAIKPQKMLYSSAHES